MPRGNDPTAAADFEGQYGVHGNAEGLIQENKLSRTQQLRSAMLRAPDQEATDELDLKKVESAAPHDNVLSAAVRGDYVVYVYEDERGDYKHGYLDRDGDKLSKPEKADDDQARLREHLDGRLEAKREAAEAEAEIEKKTREAREKAQEAALKKQSSSSG